MDSMDSKLFRIVRKVLFALQVVLGWLFFSPLLLLGIMGFLFCAFLVRRLELLFGVDRRAMRMAKLNAKYISKRDISLENHP